MPGMRLVTTVYALAVPALLGLLMIRLNQHLNFDMGVMAWTSQAALMLTLSVSITSRDFRLISVVAIMAINALVILLLGNTESPWWDDRLVVLLNIAAFYILSVFRFPFPGDADSPTPFWLWIPFYIYLAMGIFLALGLFVRWSPLTEFILLNAAAYSTLAIVLGVSLRRHVLSVQGAPQQR